MLAVVAVVVAALFCLRGGGRGDALGVFLTAVTCAYFMLQMSIAKVPLASSGVRVACSGAFLVRILLHKGTH